MLSVEKAPLLCLFPPAPLNPRPVDQKVEDCRSVARGPVNGCQRPANLKVKIVRLCTMNSARAPRKYRISLFHSPIWSTAICPKQHRSRYVHESPHIPIEYASLIQRSEGKGQCQVLGMTRPSSVRGPAASEPIYGSSDQARAAH